MLAVEPAQYMTPKLRKSGAGYVWTSYLSFVLYVVVLLISVRCNAQTSGNVAASAVPDPRIEEARHRLTLSRRRRGQQTIQNARNNQLILLGNLPAKDIVRMRVRHRPTSMHRNTTALGRKSVVAPSSKPVP